MDYSFNQDHNNKLNKKQTQNQIKNTQKNQGTPVPHELVSTKLITALKEKVFILTFQCCTYQVQTK